MSQDLAERTDLEDTRFDAGDRTNGGIFPMHLSGSRHGISVSKIASSGSLTHKNFSPITLPPLLRGMGWPMIEDYESSPRFCYR